MTQTRTARFASRRSVVLVAVMLAFATPQARGDDSKALFKRQQDVIYGRLPGVALTMDVFSPKDDAKVKANGAGVIWVVSGGWASAHESIDTQFLGKSLAELVLQPLTDRG